MRRAFTSTALPGPVGTIQRTGLLGYVCAIAELQANSRASSNLISFRKSLQRPY